MPELPDDADGVETVRTHVRSRRDDVHAVHGTLRPDGERIELIAFVDRFPFPHPSIRITYYSPSVPVIANGSQCTRLPCVAW